MLKYHKIKNYLLSTIRHGRHGELLPSQSELARKFKVNHLTVRRTWEELESEGLISRARGKGIFIKKVPLSGERITFLTIVSQDWKSKPEDFSATVMHEIIKNTCRTDIALHILPYLGHSANSLSMDFHAVLSVAPMSTDHPTLNGLRQRGHPVMLLNRVEDDYPFDYVSTDHRWGAAEVTRHLLETGHRRIGFVGLLEGESHYSQRHQGYADAFKSLNLSPPEEMVVRSPSGVEGEALRNEVANRFEKMLLACQPTAVLTSMVFYLPAVLSVLECRKMSIPQDVEVATFDNVPIRCKQKKHIHEVVQPVDTIVAVAVEELRRKIIQQKKGRINILIPPTVKIKTSP